MFEQFHATEDDPIEAVFARIAADRSPDRLDLGIGVYRDETGRAPVMRSVLLAEREVVAEERPKAYLSPLGNDDYCQAIRRLVLGADHELNGREQARMICAQTAGAGAALRIGADLVYSIRPQSRVWVPDPVWSHQVDFFRRAGLEICVYRYYDRMSGRLLEQEMFDDLAAMRADDLLLLHGCCHNPTGADPSAAQWAQIADLLEQTGAIPFIDIAYQGFGDGIDEDVRGVRLLASRLPELLIAVSSSKSFTVYRDRAGMLAVISRRPNVDHSALRRHMRDLVRQLYFMPPDHGAAVVERILTRPELEKLWREELDAIRTHIVKLRATLHAALVRHCPGRDFAYLLDQKGMFSCLPVTLQQQQRLEAEFGIYMLPQGRINFAALGSSSAERVATALAAVLAHS